MVILGFWQVNIKVENKQILHSPNISDIQSKLCKERYKSIPLTHKYMTAQTPG
jgi:hypothetical protein